MVCYDVLCYDMIDAPFTNQLDFNLGKVKVLIFHRDRDGD